MMSTPQRPMPVKKRPVSKFSYTPNDSSYFCEWTIDSLPIESMLTTSLMTWYLRTPNSGVAIIQGKTTTHPKNLTTHFHHASFFEHTKMKIETGLVNDSYQKSA